MNDFRRQPRPSQRQSWQVSAFPDQSHSRNSGIRILPPASPPAATRSVAKAALPLEATAVYGAHVWDITLTEEHPGARASTGIATITTCALHSSAIKPQKGKQHYLQHSDESVATTTSPLSRNSKYPITNKLKDVNIPLHTGTGHPQSMPILLTLLRKVALEDAECHHMLTVSHIGGKMPLRRSHSDTRKVRKILGLLTAVAIATISTITATPSSASAGTCTIPGCGGIVNNYGTSPWSIRVANNWCWSSQTTYVGDTLPCVTNPGSSNTYQADFELPYNKTTGTYYFYYDTDAFRVYRGCKVTYHLNSIGPLTNDRRSLTTSLWIKISSVDRVTIDSIAC
ncbi:hypothetical protein [Micromonospora oryzae]|uniref:hypothetical protein n=1 Tax=Micromonospora sp. DSM 102119 TaxID=3111768 RepID=UPI0031DD51B6